jgi:CHAT domain-containing protein
LGDEKLLTVFHSAWNISSAGPFSMELHRFACALAVVFLLLGSPSREAAAQQRPERLRTSKAVPNRSLYGFTIQDFERRLAKTTDPLTRAWLLASLSNYAKEDGDLVAAERWGVEWKAALEGLPPDARDSAPTGAEGALAHLKRLKNLPAPDRRLLQRQYGAVFDAAMRGDFRSALRENESLLTRLQQLKFGIDDRGYAEALVGHAAFARQMENPLIARAALSAALPSLESLYGKASEQWRNSAADLLQSYERIESAPLALLEEAVSEFKGRSDYADVWFESLLGLALRYEALDRKKESQELLAKVEASLKSSDWLLFPRERLSYYLQLGVNNYEIHQPEDGRRNLKQAERLIFEIPADQWTDETFALCAAMGILESITGEIGEARKIADLAGQMLNAADRRLIREQMGSPQVTVGAGLSVPGSKDAESALYMLQGVCDFFVGNWERSASHLGRAIDNQKSATEDPTGSLQVSVVAHELLAIIESRAGHESKAREHANLVAESASKLLRRVLVHSDDERVQLADYGTLRGAVDAYLAAWPDEAQRAYQLVLDWKGVVGRRQLVIRRGKHSKLERDATTAIATLESGLRAKSDRRQVPTIAEIERLDAAKKQLLAIAEAEKDQPGGVRTGDVVSAVPEKTVLLDFVTYFAYEKITDATSGVEIMRAAPRRVAVFVVSSRGVQRFDLGNAKQVEQAVNQWLALYGVVGSAESSQLPKLAEAEAKTQLRDIVWGPVADAVNGMESIIICPDGVLCKLPFAAISGPDGASYLIEKFSFRYQPSAHFLLDMKKIAANDKPTGAYLVGDLEYGEVKNEGDFGKLDHSADEIRHIKEGFAKLSPKAVITERRGNEVKRKQVLEELPKYSHSVFSTHGTWKAKPSDDFVDRGALWITSGGGAPLIDANSFRRAGLVLSGFNATSGEARNEAQLTAMDVARLSLDNTQLVILSACDTTSGLILEGEGVLGLQRAFQLAGAQTVVGTLWPVREGDSLVAMNKFYKYLGEDQNKPDEKQRKLGALRRTQLELLFGRDIKGFAGSTVRVDNLGTQRESPRLWAGWILSGLP